MFILNIERYLNYEEIHFFSKKYDNILLIKYEDLLLNSNKIVFDICTHIKKDISDEVKNTILGNLNQGKAYSYKDQNITKYTHELLSLNKFYKDE